LPIVHNKSSLAGSFVRLEGLTFDGLSAIGTGPLLSIQGHDIEILGNEFRANNGAAIDVSAAGTSPDRVHVVANVFHNGAQGLLVHDGADLLVASNVFRDHSIATIVLDPLGSGAILAANTMARGQTAVTIGADATAKVSGVLIINSILTGNGSGAIVAPSSGLNNVARGNLFYGNKFQTSGAVADIGNSNGDPEYVTLHDLTLQPTSPALGFADPAYTPVIDRNGRCRPLGQGPDLGAYEQ
jgi:hypothetical protein